MTERLSAANLGGLRGSDVVLPPTLDRAAPPAVVHLGVGGFARAHLATYADDLTRLGHSLAIHGVSLRSERAERLLGPQDGLYCLVEREPDDRPPLRVVGSLVRVGTGVDAALDALASPSTRLVTLTVTEKGYEVDPSDADPSGPPTSTPAVVARGLARRRAAGLVPPVLAPLDNVGGNGSALRARVLEVAEAWDGELARWIEAEVAFVSSVVDRMVPATTDADRDEVEVRLGRGDEAPVVAEHHRSWALTRVDGLPPLDDVGVELVADVGPHERRKLWLLNGPHSATAYAGLLRGHSSIAVASVDPVVDRFVRGVVDEALAVADPSMGDAAAYAADALRRFANPALAHTCAQVAADGSRKLAERLLPVVARRREAGLTSPRAAAVAALWLVAASGLAVDGRPLLPPVDDPLADGLRAAVGRGDDRARLVGLALPAADRSFAEEVTAAIGTLVDGGPALVASAP